MSQGRSRSKFSGVREKLLRFRRDYFCIRSGSEQRPGCAARNTRPPDIGGDSVQLPPLVSGRAVGYRHSCDGGQQTTTTTTNGDSSTMAEDGLLLRRHSVPSRCVAIPESPEEEEHLMVVTPTNCRPTKEVVYAIAELMDDGLSTEYDHSDYDEFVRGLQPTTVTAASTIHLDQPVEAAADISAGTVCRSTQRPVGVESTATPCSLGGRTSEPSERRSLGGKLMRTLRKTFSLAGLGKNDEPEDDSLTADTAQHTSSSFDKQSPHLPPLFTPSLGNLQPMQSIHRLDKDCDKLERKQPSVS